MAKKKNLTVMEKVSRRSYILRKRRVLSRLWARVDEVEEGTPKSLEEAVEMSRQSRRWRKRLALFTRLKMTAFPSHALLVDCWGKELLLASGTRRQIEKLLDGSKSIQTAGYKLVCLGDIANGKQQIDEMKFMQGKEDGNNDHA